MSARRHKSHTVKKAVKARILKAQGGACADCGGTNFSAYNPAEPHHVVHVAHGGGNEESNIVMLCRRCHVARHQKGTE